MRIHIVGSGPTGMSIAWEILKTKKYEVIIYDRKKSAGGSWWEPEGNKRDIHAHRIVFGNAFKNTSDLFNQMGFNSMIPSFTQLRFKVVGVNPNQEYGDHNRNPKRHAPGIENG